jgi:hypothetical protein
LLDLEEDAREKERLRVAEQEERRQGAQGNTKTKTLMGALGFF